MPLSPAYVMHPDTDLLLERVIDVPRATVWAAWTQPELLKQWFTPRPWTTPLCEIDLRPGGVFRTVMRSPEGEEGDNSACYLEIVENERLVWTTSLRPGYRPPAGPQDLPFTAVISMESVGTTDRASTKYSALVMHPDAETCKRHDEMGFHDGWGEALNQLVELAASLG